MSNVSSTSGTSSTIEQLLSGLPWTVEESGWSYNGPFSTYKELHAAILGFAAAGHPVAQAAVLAYATGRGSTRSKKDPDAHWRQVAEEPAYALGAMKVAEMANEAGLAEMLGEAIPLVTGVII